MMTDQGKTSNVNAIGVLSRLAGKAAGTVGMTKFRPPFNPVSFGAVAGRHVGAFYRPMRQLPNDELPRQAGDRKSVVKGKSVTLRVNLGGRRINKKKKKQK